MCALTIVSAGIALVAAVFALLAAGLWWLSAVVKIPDKMPTFLVGGLPSASAPALQDLAKALKRQSKRSAWAAFCAGVSAFLSAVSVLVALCAS